MIVKKQESDYQNNIEMQNERHLLLVILKVYIYIISTFLIIFFIYFFLFFCQYHLPVLGYYTDLCHHECVHLIIVLTLELIYLFFYRRPI